TGNSCQSRLSRRSLHMEALEERTLPCFCFLDGGEYAVGAFPRSLAVGRFTPDGTIGVATANQVTHSISLLFSNADGTLESAGTYDAGPSAFSIYASDLRNIGLDDIVVTNFFNDSISVLLNNGDGTFQDPVTYSTGAHSHPIALAVADLTGDGVLSL